MGKGLLGCGSVFYAEIDASGNKGSWVNFGNSTKFEIKENTKLEERKGRGCDNYGAALDSVVVREASDINISLDEFNRKNLATAFLGESSAVVLAGGTVTDEAHTVTDAEGFAKVAHGNISNVTITGSVLDTDYAVKDAANGLISFIEGGNITDGSSVLVSYDYAAATYDTVTSGVNPNKRIALMLIGKNMADNKGLTAVVHETTISPTSSVDFLSDTFSTIDLSGKVILSESGQSYDVVYNKTVV